MACRVAGAVRTGFRALLSSACEWRIRMLWGAMAHGSARVGALPFA